MEEPSRPDAEPAGLKIKGHGGPFDIPAVRVPISGHATATTSLGAWPLSWSSLAPTPGEQADHDHILVCVAAQACNFVEPATIPYVHLRVFWWYFLSFLCVRIGRGGQMRPWRAGRVGPCIV